MIPFRPLCPETLIQGQGRIRIPALTLFRLRLTWEFG